MISEDKSFEGIAVVGMAGRFPMAENVEQFWENIAAGRDCFKEFTIDQIISEGVPREVAEQPDYVRRSPVLENPAGFDSLFFKISPKEAELIDPQQRILLECAWNSLENAGHDPSRFPGLIGIWAGSGINNYLLKNIVPRGSFETIVNFQTIVSNDKDYLASRVAYKLGLRGPAVVVQTACSTSLVAVNMACLALLTYQCDMALAGAVFLQTPRARGYLYHEGEIFSPDGFVRAFDKNANGTVLGEGCGLVVLRRLEDAIEDHDNILAVIKGSAINNDGSDRAGYTAPGVNGQMELITMAQTMAGVSPDEISYIEAHGTGTSIGDPIEVTALTQVFRKTTDEKGFCGLGSVKNNIGHLDVAAGIAGLIKTICALKHKQIPPTINFKEPNPDLSISETPFYIVDKLVDWDTRNGRRIAGVSSFGMGGTNAHVILEEFPSVEPSSSSRPLQLIVLSAKKETALETMSRNLGRYLSDNNTRNLADIAFTMQTGREEMNYRSFFVCNDMEDAVKKLNSPDGGNTFSQKVERNNPPVVFMFPGQGSQYVNMGLNLYKYEPEFKAVVDNCAETLIPFLGTDLRDILYPKSGGEKNAEELLKKTAFQQPAMFTIEYALARLWINWGIKPAAMIGHSIGEYAAACLANVFSLEEALMLVANRGRMMQELPGGSMLSLRVPAMEIETRLPSDLSLAAVNGPSLCVVSGPSDSIIQFQTRLKAEGIVSMLLHTSHAFHSSMMEPIVKPFTELAGSIHLSKPCIPFVSTVTGQWISPEQASDSAYWGGQLRAAVRFAEGIQTLWETQDYVLLEVGPRTTAATLARQQIKDKSKQKAIASLSDNAANETEWKALLNAMGNLWLSGVQISWNKFYENEKRYRIPLPTYPFEYKKYWLEPVDGFYHTAQKEDFSRTDFSEENIKPLITGESERENDYKSDKKQSAYLHSEAENVVAGIWQEVLGVDEESVYNNFFRDLGGDSLSVLKVIALIRKKAGIYLTPETIMMNTVEKIAELIEQGGASSENENVEADDQRQKMLTDLIPYYFGDPEKKLCGVYYPPCNKVEKSAGVLLCYPLPQEYMTSHSSFRQLSRLLSNAGLHVLKFDYFGTGDSAGESVDVNIKQCISDILTAANELKDRYNVDEISLVGLRFGAALAFQAAADHEINFRDLVLWDPVLNGEAYIKEMEGIRDEMRISYMPKLRKQLIGNDYCELLGYPWMPEHRDSVKRMDLFDNSLPAVNKVYILTSEEKVEYKRFNDHLCSNGVASTYQVVKDVNNWGKLTSMVDVQFPSRILHEIVLTLSPEDK